MVDGASASLCSAPSNTERLQANRSNVHNARDTNISEISQDGNPGVNKEIESSAQMLQSDLEAWACLLDPYLPLELRSKTWLENLAQFDGIRPINTLPNLLIHSPKSLSDDALNFGVLSYVALKQRRWPAVLWLVEALLKFKPAHQATISDVVLKHSPWSKLGSVDEMSETRLIFIEPPSDIAEPIATMDSITGSIECWAGGELIAAYRGAIGQVWYLLGHVIIDAAAREPDEQKKLMSYVHEIIASLHHHDVVAPSIYEHNSSEVPASLRKPPTLAAVRSRILTIISDSAWKAEQRKNITEAEQLGASHIRKAQDLPWTVWEPRLHTLGPEIWLDFVLWACIQGGWVKEAGRLVWELVEGSDGGKWSAISWDMIQKVTFDKEALSNAQQPSWFTAQLHKLSGAIEGYSYGIVRVNIRKGKLC